MSDKQDFISERQGGGVRMKILKEILRELILIREELRAIRNNAELKHKTTDSVQSELRDSMILVNRMIDNLDTGSKTNN